LTTYSAIARLRTPESNKFNWDEEWADNAEIVDTIIGSVLGANKVLTGGDITFTASDRIDIDGCTFFRAGAYGSTTSTYLIFTPAPDADTPYKYWVYVNSSGAVALSASPPTGDYVLLGLLDITYTANTAADLRQYGYGSKTYDLSFLNGDLTGTTLTVTHNMNIEYPAAVTVWNGSGVEVTQQTTITSTGVNSLTVDLTGFTPLSGTWTLAIRG